MATSDVTQDEAPSAEELLESVLTCEPALPPEEMEALADRVRSNEFVGRPWRLTALLASKDGSFFRDVANSQEHAQALAPTVDVLHAFAKSLRGMADLADCAAARVLVAGCNHPDFNKWTGGSNE